MIIRRGTLDKIERAFDEILERRREDPFVEIKERKYKGRKGFRVSFPMNLNAYYCIVQSEFDNNFYVIDLAFSCRNRIDSTYAIKKMIELANEYDFREKL